MANERKMNRGPMIAVLGMIVLTGLLSTSPGSSFGQRLPPMQRPPTLTRFFCEPAKENQCGSRFVNCSGQVFSEGCQTAFNTTETVTCNFFPMLSLACPGQQ
jgi:hypothetical protein